MIFRSAVVARLSAVFWIRVHNPRKEAGTRARGTADGDAQALDPSARAGGSKVQARATVIAKKGGKPVVARRMATKLSFLFLRGELAFISGRRKPRAQPI